MMATNRKEGDEVSRYISLLTFEFRLMIRFLFMMRSFVVNSEHFRCQYLVKIRKLKACLFAWNMYKHL